MSLCWNGMIPMLSAPHETRTHVGFVFAVWCVYAPQQFLFFSNEKLYMYLHETKTFGGLCDKTLLRECGGS
jgi:hypothetical protein